jgi:hypothetical protein
MATCPADRLRRETDALGKSLFAKQKDEFAFEISRSRRRGSEASHVGFRCCSPRAPICLQTRLRPIARGNEAKALCIVEPLFSAWSHSCFVSELY